MKMTRDIESLITEGIVKISGRIENLRIPTRETMKISGRIENLSVPTRETMKISGRIENLDAPTRETMKISGRIENLDDLTRETMKVTEKKKGFRKEMKATLVKDMVLLGSLIERISFSREDQKRMG
jgi:hypothetical protein